jgi:hypothetical protein
VVCARSDHHLQKRVHLLYCRLRGVPLGVHGIRPQRPDSDLPDHLVAVDVLLRREPDEDEEEDEDEDGGGGKEDEDDDDEDESFASEGCSTWDPIAAAP